MLQGRQPFLEHRAYWQPLLVSKQTGDTVMSPALLLACQPCTRSSRLLAACTPSAVLAVMIPMPTGILPRSDRSSLWIASLGISVQHVRAHNTELCCKRHLCDNHCSMVQPDVRRGGGPGVQTLLLQAHAAGGGASGISSLLLLCRQPAATCTCDRHYALPDHGMASRALHPAAAQQCSGARVQCMPCAAGPALPPNSVPR